MKKFAYSLLKALPAILIMAACSQTEEPDIDLSLTEQTTRATDETPSFSTSTKQRNYIARWLAENYTIEEAQRVHNAVQISHSVGLDEFFYLKEFLSENTASNKVVREAPSEISKKFKSELLNGSLAKESVMSTQSNNPIEELLNNERLVIYWPYSENWDGITTPVLVYAPQNLSELNALGYVLNKDTHKLDIILVNEQYSEQHPVWIITESETPYSQLPNFANGETVSPDGILYSPNKLPPIGIHPPYPYPYPDPLPKDSSRYYQERDIITLRLGYVRSEKNHDTWFAGGSEYVFRFAYAKNTNLKCEADTSNCIPDVARTKICFTRKEIKHKTQKELNAIAVSDWPKSLENIIMTLVEEDGGKERQYNASVTVTWKDKKYGIDVSIPYKNNDDDIAKRTYSRNFIMSTNNYKGKDENGNEKWAEDYSDGVYWTLPYETGEPIYNRK
ncbi:MAG: hypothetical protein K2K25_03985 [Muribaculaceae bacterium]|nr:hypothetical protein [Muribaculaceae bacterium]